MEIEYPPYEIEYPPYTITDKMLNYVSDIMKK